MRMANVTSHILLRRKKYYYCDLGHLNNFNRNKTMCFYYFKYL